ncbi:MinD/ParA family protein [Streptomyces sp. NPDC021100]|uniref:MinD/ParA family protein n=1 Tax=Streptomyces sp. NPDC021100 TaxID=3365114 RepID=UPI0037A09025
MPVTALVSAKSCGTTASALALTLASRRPSLLAECDPAGGTIRAGFLQGAVTAGYGLYHLAAAERIGRSELANAFAHHLWGIDDAGHRKLLPGLTDPAQAPALTRTWPALAEVLKVLAADAGHDVFVDVGRLALEAGRLHPTLTPAPLLHAADFVLLTVRANDQSLTLARHLIEPLRTELDEHGTGSDALGLLLIEDGPYRPTQVATALHTPVLAALPWDAETAGYLTTGGRPPRGYARSPLLRHARSATDQLDALAQRRSIYLNRSAPDANLAGVLQRLTNARGGSRG